jgi:osmotically-inducible protein OsmY
MKTNQELQKDVQNALQWEPLLHAAEIGVTAIDGVITLSGTVDSFAKKLEAETAAKKVLGVKAIVETILIQLPNSIVKSNGDIAADVLFALNSNWSIPKNKITIKVEYGWVTLEGELPWNYQRDAAKNAINYLIGVKGISNNIVVKAESKDTIEQKEVEKAIARAVSIDDTDISVTVDGSTVTLHGTVNSWYQKEEAGRVAWNTKGIWHVKNNLTVDYYYSITD